MTDWRDIVKLVVDRWDLALLQPKPAADITANSTSIPK